MTKQEKRKIRRGELIRIKGGCCQTCGYDTYAGALQFHHKDPKTKLFKLGINHMDRCWESLVKEAAKCALLCGNCHAEVHADLRNV